MIVDTLASPNHSQLNFSSFIPFSLLNTWPPVKTAISSKTSFCLSPNSGALTAHTFNVPLILFTIRVASASLSISLAMIKSDLFVFDTLSNIGSNSFTCVKVWSAIKI